MRTKHPRASVQEREWLMLLMDIGVCVQCLSTPAVPIWFIAYFKSIDWVEKWKELIFERPLLSPSQGLDSQVSDLHEITARWLRTRVGNPCAHVFSHIDDTNKHKNTQTIYQFAQFRFTHYLWILMLFICISSNSCCGTRVITHSRSQPHTNFAL